MSTKKRSADKDPSEETTEQVIVNITKKNLAYIRSKGCSIDSMVNKGIENLRWYETLGEDE